MTTQKFAHLNRSPYKLIWIFQILALIFFSVSPPLTASAAGDALTVSTPDEDITFEDGSLIHPTSGVDSVTGAVVLDNSASIKGLFAARIPGVDSAYLQKDFTAVEDVYLSFYLKLNALPVDDVPLAQISNAGTTAGSLILRSSGTLQLRAGASDTGAGTAPLTVGMIYRLGLHQKRGTGGDAILEGYLATGDGPFAVPFASTAAGDWTTPADSLRLGTPTTIALDALFDDIKIDFQALPGPSLPTPAATPTDTSIPTTATPLPPRDTPIPPSATLVTPTATPTAILAFPTATRTVAPSATRTVAPTATRIAPTATRKAPTATRVRPTATRKVPTATRVARTATRVRRTATPTIAPVTPLRKARTPTPTRGSPTRTPVPTRTSSPTLTHIATSTSTPIPSSTAAPGATVTPGSALLPLVDPLILGTCPAAVHDRYTVIGLDGKLYRTWHPITVLLDPTDPLKGTCTFAHEHGDDPTKSLANPSLPPFSYIGLLAGDNEPHEGFKVFVANRGAVNDEGRTAQTSTRMVAHMGTGGPKRFTTALHSFMFDLVAPDGHYVHVQGMGDTGGVGSICADPRQGKTVVLAKGRGCDLESLYEIWLFRFDVGAKLTVIASTSLFDPITVMDPINPTQLVYTSNHYLGSYHGCDREAYFGPVYWYNAHGPTVYYTDVYGNIVPGGVLRQEISAHNAIGIPMSPDQTQFKLRHSQCAPGLGLKN